MIGKVGPGTALLRTDPTQVRESGNPGFESLLQNQMDRSQPVDRLRIEFLRRVVEAFLPRSGSEEELFFAPPLFMPDLSFSPSPPLSSPPAPPFVPPPVPVSETSETAMEVSKNQQVKAGFDPVVEEAARRYGVDPALVRAVIQVESGGDPNAVSPAGAQGLMQLMPATAADLRVTRPFDPEQNILGGTRYLRQLLDRYQGDLRLALGAYNWGMGNLERRPEAMPRETRDYIVRVESLYQGQAAARPFSFPGKT
jgi:hypothetical protein